MYVWESHLVASIGRQAWGFTAGLQSLEQQIDVLDAGENTNHTIPLTIEHVSSFAFYFFYYWHNGHYFSNRGTPWGEVDRWLKDPNPRTSPPKATTLAVWLPPVISAGHVIAFLEQTSMGLWFSSTEAHGWLKYSDKHLSSQSSWDHCHKSDSGVPI